MKNLPMWAEFHRTPHLDIALLENFEEKIEKIAHATKDVNVTSISGVPTWNLVLFKRILEITGKNNLLEVWPNLEMYFHGAVNFTPYREQFKKLIPNEEHVLPGKLTMLPKVSLGYRIPKSRAICC
jgi:hypothetical protein